MWTDEYMGNYHDVATITLQELEEIGFFDWESESWNWQEFAYSETVYNRLCTAFFNRFKWREISIVPPLQWRDQLIAKIKYELCPKYNRWYKLIEEFDDVNISLKEDEYGKSRDVGSEFPETLLSGNSVYASNGKDVEYEKIKERNPLELLDVLERQANWNIDKMFLDELESFFNGVWYNDTQAW